MIVRDLLVNQLDKRFIYGSDEPFVEDTFEGLVALCQPFNNLPKPEGMYGKKTVHPRFSLGMRERIFKILSKKIPFKNNPFNRYDRVVFIGVGGVNANLMFFLVPFLYKGEGSIISFDPEEWELHNFCRLCLVPVFRLKADYFVNSPSLFEGDSKICLFRERDLDSLSSKENHLFLGSPNESLKQEMLEKGDILDIFFQKDSIGIEFLKRGTQLPKINNLQWLSNDNYWKVRISDYISAVLLALMTIPRIVGERKNLSLKFRFDKEVADFKNYLLSIQ